MLPRFECFSSVCNQVCIRPLRHTTSPVFSCTLTHTRVAGPQVPARYTLVRNLGRLWLYDA